MTALPEKARAGTVTLDRECVERYDELRRELRGHVYEAVAVVAMAKTGSNPGS
jgi:hypothetical protein